jgi:hypothetical protein
MKLMTNSIIKKSKVKNIKINVVKLWLTAVLSSILMSWALLLPFGGVADEPAYWHYGIATANDVFKNEELLRKGDINNIVSSSCFGFKSDVIANCQYFSSDANLIMAKPSLIDYPKLSYIFTAWPVFISQGENAMLFSRLASTLLSMILIGLGIVHWQRSTKKLILGILFALPSLSVHLIASYNSNGIEIASLIGFSLMLFGRNKLTKEFKQNWKWWFSFVTIIIFASTAKPLSGLFVLLLTLIYFKIENNDLSMKEFSRVKLLFKKNISLIVSGSLATATTLISSLDSLRKAKTLSTDNPTPDLIQAGWNFLLKSESYFFEYAGIFGWRDTGTAPWTLLIWMLTSFMMIYIAFNSAEKKERRVLLYLWIGITIFFPLLETLLLTINFNVGLQTRYLAGLFAFVAIYTVTLIKDNLLTRFKLIIVILIAINLLNLAWNYFRYSIGITKMYSWKSFISGIIDSNSWQPTYFIPGVFVFTCVIVLLILMPIRLMEGIRNQHKLLKISIVYLLAILFLFASDLDIEKKNDVPNLTSGISISSPDRPIGELTVGNEISQSFVAEADGLRKIDVLAATYARKNFGKIKVEVFENSKQLILTKELDVSKITDNGYLSILIPKQLNSKGKSYQISFTSMDGTPGNAITFWENSTNPYPNGEARLGNQELGDLCFTLYYEKF